MVESHEYSESYCYGKKKYECVNDDYRIIFIKILGGIFIMCFMCFCFILIIGGRRGSRSYPVQVVRLPEPRVNVINIESNNEINLNDEGL